MGKCKTKAIQTDLGTFRHNEASSKPCVSLAYSEPWYIQNHDIFKTRNILRTLVYSEPRCIEDSGIFEAEGLFRHLRCQVSYSDIYDVKYLRWSVLSKQLMENSFEILFCGVLYFIKQISWRSYSRGSYSM